MAEPDRTADWDSPNRSGALEFEAGEAAVVAPVFQQAAERDDAGAVGAVLAHQHAVRLPFVVVVTGRAGFKEPDAARRAGDHLLHPLLFRLLRYLQRAYLALARLLDQVGDVPALLFQHMREVGAEADLRHADDEAVGEAARLHAEQGANAVLPLLRERLAAAAVDVVAGAPFQRRAPLEAAGEDDAVNLVLDAVRHDAALGDPLDAAAIGIHQRHVRAVEGRQVFVVEAGPLAELAVVWLQRLGRLRVSHDRLRTG